jgi:hypothetical protein
MEAINSNTVLGLSENISSQAERNQIQILHLLTKQFYCSSITKKEGKISHTTCKMTQFYTDNKIHPLTHLPTTYPAT